MRCCYRYAPGRTGNIQKHTAQQASHDVQCHAVQGDTSCLQKVHARCNYTIFLLTSIYNCSYLVGIFVSRTKHKPHYKYQCRRIRGLGDLDAALKIPSSKKKRISFDTFRRSHMLDTHVQRDISLPLPILIPNLNSVSRAVRHGVRKIRVRVPIDDKVL